VVRGWSAVIADGKLCSFAERVNVHAHLPLGLVPSATGTAVDQIASGEALCNGQ
jgi:hypothetical protein